MAEPAQTLEERLETLEVRLAYQDDTIQQLNDVIVRQQRQIDQFETRYQQLVDRLSTLAEAPASDAAPATFEAALENEKPPHY